MYVDFDSGSITAEEWNNRDVVKLCSDNTLLIGATQTGKSTLSNEIVNQVYANGLGKTVIFEVKGERVKQIEQTDYYISSKDFCCQGERFNWSILKEAKDSVTCSKCVEGEIRRIYEPIFKSAKAGNSQPYFVEAVWDLITGLTYAVYIKYGIVSNYRLFSILEASDVSQYLQLLGETGIVKRYARHIPILDNKLTPQAASVLAELSHYLRLFINLSNDTDGECKSIFDFCKSEEMLKMYIIYDYANRESNNILASMILNLIISYKLSYRPIGKQNIFLFLDEISVIKDYTVDLDYALNIGTSKGLYIIVAIQSIGFLNAIYGSDSAVAILEGFSNIVCFKMNEQKSREYIRNRIGVKNEIVQAALPLTRKDRVVLNIAEKINITDQNIASLGVGCAYVKCNINEPHKVTFKLE